MDIQLYNHQAHASAVRRIWREVGWLEAGPEMEPGVDALITAGHAYVASTSGEIECCVSTAPGEIRHLRSDLPFVCVTSVTTGRAARRQGLAARVTAHAVAEAAAGGACVAGLSVFDQGFYDRIGFGTGGYEHTVCFDPAHLKPCCQAGPPVRVTLADAEQAHSARLSRMRPHGSCVLSPVSITRSDMQLYHNGFGLGYRAPADGSLTHYVWLSTKDVEHGPYYATTVVYRTWEQFLELLGLLRTLSDQAHLIKMREPAGLQMQDLMDQPFRQLRVTEDSKFETGVHANAYWQMRVCDIEACARETKLPGAGVEFNLDVTDPIEGYLDKGGGWRGVGGAYVLAVGPSSSARRGRKSGLPTLACSVGAFTRLWLGVLPASSLSITDNLSAPAELLSALDDAFRLPRPTPDWDF